MTQDFLEQAQYLLKATGISATKGCDLIKSLDLKNEFIQIAEKKKHFMKQYVYSVKIELEFNDIYRSWIIRRRHKDFVKIYKTIKEELSQTNVDLKEIQSALIYSKCSNKDTNLLEIFTSFLNDLMQNIEIRNSSHAFYEFLEVCKLSLPSGIKIYKKGYLLKKSGGRFRENKLQTYAGVFCKRWLQRWFLISEEGFLYTINSLSTQIREVLNFDQSFKIEYGTKETGTKFGITIITSTRKIYLRAPDFFQALDWISSIQDAVKNCAYVNINRFYSFAPVRNPTSFCKWYIDGEGYFNDVYEAIIKATKEVFLTGWWISPELYLKRPVSPDNTEFRLDKVLQKIASRGVKINIILYREVKLALNNDSAYTKSALQSLSPNIKVIRHPKEFLFLWSHHEKMVVVDQSIAFLGGLDLCYGRMDTNSHPLHDPASLEGQGETFPGIDYANPRIVDFRNVREYSTSLIEKNVVPRLPWHDIAMMVVGEPVKDLTRHFIQTWNFAQIELNGKKDSFIIPKTIHRPKNEDKTESKTKNLKLKAARLKSKMKTILKLQTNSQKNAAESSDNDDQKRFDKYIRTKTRNPSLAASKVGLSAHQSDIEKGKIENLIKTEINNLDIKIEDKGIIEPIPQKEQRINRYARLDTAPQYFRRTSTDILDPKLMPMPTGDQSPLLRPIQEQDQKEAYIIKIHEEKESKTKLNENEEHQDTSVHNEINNESQNQEIEENYNKEYINLLVNAREHEDSRENMASPNVKSPLRSKLLKKFTFHDKKEKFEEEESEEKCKKLNDVFFEENMLKPLLLDQEPSPQKGACKCQVLRSASSWTLGLNSGQKILENSIQNAYVELIQNSKRFIYIENQFFISSTAGFPVCNQIAQALVLRIEKAVALNEKFRVFVFLPLLPAFEGELDDPKASVLRIQLHWLYQTICRGPNSIYKQLQQKGIQNSEKYIQFYSLRQHGKLNNVPVTEILYIHSKLMIIDDDIVIMGSANINDRSMQGSRDSEIAMITEDMNKIPSMMAGEKVLVGNFAHTLRRELWMEHLNFSVDQVIDPLNEKLIEEMNIMAQQNTEIYREVFACYPDDNIKRLNEIKEFKKLAKLEHYDSLSDKIRGHVVQFPLDFLANENLTFTFANKEYYVPDINFT